jgi:hypothetical protein
MGEAAALRPHAQPSRLLPLGVRGTALLLLWTAALLAAIHFLLVHDSLKVVMDTTARVSFVVSDRQHPQQQQQWQAGASGSSHLQATDVAQRVALSPSSIPEGSTVLLTYTNKGYADWMLNWALHARAVGAAMVVVALDDHVQQLCLNHSIPHLVPDSAAQLAGESFRADRAGKFRAMGHVRRQLGPQREGGGGAGGEE